MGIERAKEKCFTSISGVDEGSKRYQKRRYKKQAGRVQPMSNLSQETEKEQSLACLKVNLDVRFVDTADN